MYAYFTLKAPKGIGTKSWDERTAHKHLKADIHPCTHMHTHTHAHTQWSFIIYIIAIVEE